MAENKRLDTVSLIHGIPGRVRVRARALHHDNEFALALAEEILSLHGTLTVRANSSSSSITICFEPTEIDTVELLCQLEIIIAKLLSRPRPLSASISPTKNRNETHRGDMHSTIRERLARISLSFEKILGPPEQLRLGSAALIANLLALPSTITAPVTLVSLLPVIDRALWSWLLDNKPGADTIDSAACLLLIARGNYLPASITTFCLALGEFIRYKVTERCATLVDNHLALTESSAWLVTDEDFLENNSKSKPYPKRRVPRARLHDGDIIAVYPGESIAGEGIVVKGDGTIAPAHPGIDEVSRELITGSPVSSGWVLFEGKVYIKLSKHTSLHEKEKCKFIPEKDLFTKSRTSHDPIERKRMERWLQRTAVHRQAMALGRKKLIPVLSLSAASYLLTRRIDTAVSIATFDFTSAIKIVIPVTVLSAMEQAGERGIIFRSAAAMERLAEVDTVIFGKSGTLTAMSPQVTDIYTGDGFEIDSVIALAAAVSGRYHYLQACAVFEHARKKGILHRERVNSKLINGLGVEGEVDGRKVLVGRSHFLESQGVILDKALDFLANCEARGDSRACIAIDGKLASIFAYRDPVRPEAPRVISALKNMAIEVAMITGGSQGAAERVAEKVGIDKIFARTSPYEAAKLVRSYRQAGRRVAMVGDDVADELPLEAADLAICPHSAIDAARLRADIILASGLDGLTTGMIIARESMRRADENLVLSTLPNWLGLTLSASGTLSSGGASLLNNGAVVLGAYNGLRQYDAAVDKTEISQRFMRQESSLPT